MVYCVPLKAVYLPHYADNVVKLDEDNNLEKSYGGEKALSKHFRRRYPCLSKGGDKMSIALYEHNRIAYESVVSMLAQTGKAAVVHPTGTGKSFIGFKLCEDNPDKTVLWLSPSAYIFKTQIENLEATGAEVPQNILYFTYAALANMSEEEMAKINPGLAVWDEFHRAGSPIWGAAVRKFLSMYPNVPVLGLSATNIRYLDNQRDMADELFDGNVASEMTLGEAIVRGILSPPKYVTTVYSYTRDLERLARRVRHLRNKPQREKAEQYIEALRRALEMADGLDVVFDKNMTDRTGKYIVFCANKAHMDEMMEKTGEWFAKLDKHPHVYSVYADDPGASKSFAAFKSDDDSTHLRLLYCIDALNEGIHVENVSGVILLRPTVSPIIYKQQIGRALSASKSKESVIFDIVNNIAGLYSIDSIEDEMQEVVQYYQFRGESGNIVNDRFRVIDAVEDCRRLFDDLEETLSASWEFMYAEAKAYYEANGDLLPTQSYVTENGVKLGKWLVTQRINYRNKSGISQSRIDKLERIGMNWQTLHERQWDEGYALAQQYYREHGDLKPTRQMSEKLAYWLVKQRQKQREGRLTDKQFAKLSALGMVWAFEDAWEQKFALAKQYYEQNGNLDIPAAYKTDDGISLGVWYRGVRDQYRNGTLTEERKCRLESIGVQWGSVQTRNWMQYYALAKQYYKEHGDLNIPANYVTSDGVKLGVWIASQRYSMKKNRISEEQIHLLDEIGMSWNRFTGKWNAAFAYAQAYFNAHGVLDPPAEYKTDDGFALGAWVVSQRRKYAVGKLKPTQIKRLESLSIVWNVTEEQWQNGYEHAMLYHKEHGNLNVSDGFVAEDGFRLGSWLAGQRTRNKNGRITEQQRERLDKLGMQWSVFGDRWQIGYEHAQAYFAQYGNLNVPSKYICEDGYTLSNWITSQRKAYKDGKLSEERVRLLRQIGMVWNTNTDRWNRGYSYAKSYCVGGGRVPIPQTYVTDDGYPLGEWVRSQERRFRGGVLESDKVQRLAEIGVIFGR